MEDAHSVEAKLTGTNSDERFKPDERSRILRSVIALSVACMIHFTAIFSCANLQSSVNVTYGIWSLATANVTLIVSTTFLSVVVIRFLGCKWTVAATLAMYIPLIIAQYHPSLYTLIPSAVIGGLGGGPLWCAVSTYLAIIAGAYAEITKNPKDLIIMRFFGIFFMILQFSQVLGNLIMSTVLSSMNSKSDDLFSSSVRKLPQCGANTCPIDMTQTTLLLPSKHQMLMLTSIQLGFIICAVAIVGIFVDPLSRYDEPRRERATVVGGVHVLVIVFKQLRDMKQILLLPIAMLMGISPGIISSDFTASFVTCSLGVQNVGWVMVSYGIGTALSSIASGWILKYINTRVLICSAAVIHTGILLVLLNWVPSEATAERYKFFLIAGVWGIADGVLFVQINAICGILFPGEEEAAYSVIRLWEYLGAAVAYAASAALCMFVKFYLAMATVLLGLFGYLMNDYLQARSAFRR